MLQRLPTALRPEEVKWWIKRKKAPDLYPDIERPSEFGAVWKQWWVKMQPPWRECESLIRILPADPDWDPIFRGGSNGLSLVLMSLSWWIHLTKDDKEYNAELCGAIDDVTWVISELVAELSVANGMKRTREVETDSEPDSKK
jgi:hypothetical protein